MSPSHNGCVLDEVCGYKAVMLVLSCWLAAAHLSTEEEMFRHLSVLWWYLFRSQIFLPSFIHMDYSFTLDEPLCWFHWKQLPEWSSTCCQKRGWGEWWEYKLTSLIWASNCVLFFSLCKFCSFDWVTWCIFFCFRLISVSQNPILRSSISVLVLVWWVFCVGCFFFFLIVWYHLILDSQLAEFSGLLQGMEFLRGWRRDSKQENTPEQNIL